MENNFLILFVLFTLMTIIFGKDSLNLPDQCLNGEILRRLGSLTSRGQTRSASFGKFAAQKFPGACNPQPDPNSVHYIVAYGSLMEQASKDRTDKNTGENIPVQVTGFRRQWNLKGDGVGWADTTYLGVIPDPSSTLNGVIFQLKPIQGNNILDTLQKYDMRESFYCRQMVDPSKILVYKSRPSGNDSQGGNFDPRISMEAPPSGAQYWIYVNKPEFTADPSQEFPIVQSYVDIFISGCLELQEKFNLMVFAVNCVETTFGWNGQFWKNDRIYPRRPFVYQPKAGKIDKLLMDSVPREYGKVKIEG